MMTIVYKRANASLQWTRKELAQIMIVIQWVSTSKISKMSDRVSRQRKRTSFHQGYSQTNKSMFDRLAHAPTLVYRILVISRNHTHGYKYPQFFIVNLTPQSRYCTIWDCLQQLDLIQRQCEWIEVL